MGRPLLRLSERQSADLIPQLGPIVARHASNPKIHRGFVRDFLRAVYRATGKVYGTAFYRQLLDKYAPERRPSTATIQAELEFFKSELSAIEKRRQEVDVPVMTCESHGVEPATPSPNTAVRQLFEQISHQLESLNALLQAQAKSTSPDDENGEMPALTQFYQERLISVEAELSKVRLENKELLLNAITMASNAANQYYQYQIEHTQEMIKLQERFLEYATATEVRIQELERLTHVSLLQ